MFAVFLYHVKAAALPSKTHKQGDKQEKQEREESVILARSFRFIFPDRQGTPLCSINPSPGVHSSTKWKQSQETRYLSLLLDNSHRCCPFSVCTSRSELSLYPLGPWPRKQNSKGLPPWTALSFDLWLGSPNGRHFQEPGRQNSSGHYPLYSIPARPHAGSGHHAPWSPCSVSRLSQSYSRSSRWDLVPALSPSTFRWE